MPEFILAAVPILGFPSAASATPILLESASMDTDVITVASPHMHRHHMTNHGHLRQNHMMRHHHHHDGRHHMQPMNRHRHP